VADVGVRGVGWGVRVDKDGNLFSIGEDEGVPYTSPPGPPTKFLRKIIDQGSSFSLAVVDGAWGASAFGEPTYAYSKLATDEFGNLYAPIQSGFTQLRVYKGSDGTLLHTHDYDGSVIHAVAIDQAIPDYGDDLTNPVARFVYLFGDPTDPAEAVVKLRLVGESAVTGSPRQHVHLAIAADGAIRTFDLGGPMTTPTGASGLLVTDANYIQAAQGFEKIIISDGVSPLVIYDPRTDTCSVLTSSTSGEPAHGAKILEVWQGRLVGMRAASLINGAFNWLMSAQGDFTNYDTFPVERTPSAAIGGSNAVGPGMVPDLPTGFIPYDDDIAFVGCDHAIYLLTGNPGDGGQFDLVSDITGMAFGRAWCKDPDGNVWFMGSRGGLYVMPPGSRPKRVSYNIDARLKAINFGTHYTRLAWNDDDEGIHIHRYPFGDCVDGFCHEPGNPSQCVGQDEGIFVVEVNGCRFRLKALEQERAQIVHRSFGDEVRSQHLSSYARRIDASWSRLPPIEPRGELLPVEPIGAKHQILPEHRRIPRCVLLRHALQ
jgi:hypothetical protein